MAVLITGAAGSGTSTLARALADRRGTVRVEADDIYWYATVPPFTTKRPAAERQLLMAARLRADPNAVVAGSVMGWGDEIENAFAAIVFVYVDRRTRLARLRQREQARYGRVNRAFLAWAARYDAGTAPGRSLSRHRAWLAARTCPVVELSGAMRVAEQCETLARYAALR
ncbi:AAA family ATPase [Salinisphaera sp. Q1T1-3]|uniref:AAA family ATPase n=1 Tax=Salinisphaera sp. Q1T1-3 TaxID=2321229 RepID=UPI0013148296|nr:AAA family ATPase [Salinisphaera sp. Q1T1-3]